MKSNRKNKKIRTIMSIFYASNALPWIDVYGFGTTVLFTCVRFGTM